LFWRLGRDEDAAARALQGLTGRFYAGRPILVEFSPVTDFREATCRQYEENTCTRGGYCNFMHLRPISKCAHTPISALLRLT
jgi:splicing factor U2AF subunit